MKEIVTEFQTLVEIVEKLRGPQGCPWDKEQNQKSLVQYVLEEAFELAEAIESENQKDICEELGDYIFQVILQSQVATDEKYFGITDVLKGINHKLITRHPHVFGDTKVANSEEVWRNWHAMKSAEGQQKQKPLFSYPRNLPALQAAHKIGRKTEGFRFDWTHPSQVLDKVREEFNETEEALNEFLNNLSTNSKTNLEHEIGDLLFSVAQLARHTGIDPEAALREANRRFERRFLKVLELSGKTREEFSRMSANQMNDLWIQAKKTETNK